MHAFELRQIDDGFELHGDILNAPIVFHEKATLIELIDRLSASIGAGASSSSLRIQLGLIREEAEAVDAHMQELEGQNADLIRKWREKFLLTPYFATVQRNQAKGSVAPES